MARIERVHRRVEPRRKRVAEILHEELVLVARPLVRLKEQVAARLVGVGVDEEHRLLGPLVDQPIGRLRSAERVVVDLLVAHGVFERLAGTRLRITAVEESLAVLSPREAAEFHPLDDVGQLPPGGELANVHRRPVRSAFRLAVRKVLRVGRGNET